MRILLLCNRLPFPAADGGSIAISNMAHSLHAQGHIVRILAFNTSKHPVNLENLPKEILQKFQPETVDLDNSVHIFGALSCLLSGKSYHVQRFISQAFKNKLREKLKAESFDVIQLESLFMAPYVSLIREISSAKIVMRAHNAEFKIWERLAKTSPQGLKKWYLQILARQLKNFELSNINVYDGLVSITPEDKLLFTSNGCRIPIHVTPIGLNPEEYPISLNDISSDALKLFHLGSMDWMPNQEAIQWFLEQVWPGIHKKFPEINLYIAGKNMPAWLKQKRLKNVHIEDEVKDAKSFMASGNIMIVPLLSGSGMRVKIIEGMALGKPVISTSIGAEGIEYTRDKNILIANTPDEYIAAIKKCIEAPVFLKTLGMEAAALVREKYDNKTLARELITFYKKLSGDKK